MRDVILGNLMLRRAGIGAAGALIVLAAASVLLIGEAHGAVRERPTAAPRFKVKDLAGKTLDLDTLRQRGPVLLDFWATWCKPCLEAVPEIERWHRAYGPRGLTVIGVSVDGPRNYSKVRPFANRLGITYPLVLDQDERLRHLYQVIAMPTAVLIDRDGNVATARLGYRPGEGGEMEQTIESLLAPAGRSDSDSSRTDAAGSDSAGAGRKP